MPLPEDYPKKTAFYYAADDGTFVREFVFSGWLGPRMIYARATTGHELNNERCFAERKQAVAVCVRKLRALIKKIENGAASDSRENGAWRRRH